MSRPVLAWSRSCLKFSITLSCIQEEGVTKGQRERNVNGRRKGRKEVPK